MKVAVLGSGGALGKATVAAFLAAGHDALGWKHDYLDITNASHVSQMLIGTTPDVVVNCAGVIPERASSPGAVVQVNAYAPLLLAAYCKERARLIHVSTDCVFRSDGNRWRFATEEPDATDLYGRSKAIGEMGAGATAVRTSFVTPEHGLWRWLMSQAEAGAQSVPGWMQAWWSGSTVWAVAEGLVRIAESDARNPVEHLAAPEMISKYEVLVALRRRLELPISIEGLQAPRLMRGLHPTVELQPFAAALAEAML